MVTPDQELQEIERGECVRLLAATQVGRLAVNAPDWGTPPLIRPVSYVFDRSSHSVVFRSARGSKFTALLLSGQAAFEIDVFDAALKNGWSVIALGSVEEVRDRAEMHRLDQLDLRPWAPGDKPHLLRLRVHAISGRRIA